jgi:Uncharacterized protein conserved in bacteria
MVKTSVYIFVYFCILCQFTLCQQKSNGLLWEISGNGLDKSSFLFGTFHPIEERDFETFLKQIPGFHRSFDATSQFVTEVDISIVKDVFQHSYGDRFLPIDSTYSKMLNKEDLYLLDSITLEYFNGKADEVKLSPNYLYLFCAITSRREHIKEEHHTDSTKSEGSFLDSYLCDKATENGYIVRGLDTREIREKLLYRTYWNTDSLPKTLMESTTRLIELLKEFKKDSNQFSEEDYQRRREKIIQTMKLAYFNKQDLWLVEECAKELDEMDFRNYKSDSLAIDYLKNQMKITLHERNQLWIQQIPDLIIKEPSFIAVGALHLCGETGLINQLRKMGYTVKPVE